jgi:hypothetical protein
MLINDFPYLLSVKIKSGPVFTEAGFENLK